VFLSGREVVGIWEGAWHLVFSSDILESISLHFASVVQVWKYIGLQSGKYFCWGPVWQGGHF